MAGGQLAGTEAFLQGKPCPKCGHVRTAADTNPAWQCPKCQVAYAKVRPATASATSAASRLVAGGRELAAEAGADYSVYTLIAANLFSAAVAVYFNMPVRALVLVYWLQSLFIGLSFFVRILCLRAFTVNRNPDGFERVPGKLGANVSAAFSFLGAYALAHAFYLTFLWEPKAGPGTSIIAISACALAFALNHLFSLFHNISLDSKATPNLNAMLFIPIVRILPMHIMVMTGFALTNEEETGRTFGLMVLIALKTGADVLMHVVEHHELRKNPLDR